MSAGFYYSQHDDHSSLPPAGGCHTQPVNDELGVFLLNNHNHSGPPGVNTMAGDRGSTDGLITEKTKMTPLPPPPPLPPKKIHTICKPSLNSKVRIGQISVQDSTIGGVDDHGLHRSKPHWVFKLGSARRICFTRKGIKFQE